MDINYLNLSEDRFYEEFRPVKNHLEENAAFDGCMFETFGKEFDYVNSMVPTHSVWTILDAEGHLSIVSGYHYVNRLGYMITEKPVELGVEYTVDLEDETQSNSSSNFEQEIEDIDPDSKMPVSLSVFKHEGGGMFAVDSSYIEQCFQDDEDVIIPDPLNSKGDMVVLNGV